MPVDFGLPLSDREHEIVVLVAEGLTNREIAARLFVSPNTVKVHLRNIFTKTGVSSRTELSMLAVQEGWIQVAGPLAEDKDLPQVDLPQEPLPPQPAQAEPEPAQPEPLAPWPAHRWAAAAIAGVLVLVIWLLPVLRVPQTAASGPGDVFGLSAQPSDATAVSGGEWSELPPLPVRRAGMGVAALDNRIFVIGGMMESGPTARVDAYVVEEGVWEEVAARPAALANVAAAAVNDRIVVPGGCNADWGVSSLVHIYDVTSQRWMEAAPLPVPVCAYALASYEDKVYLMGGWDGQAYQAHAFVYETETDSWRAISSPRFARGFGAATTLSDRILYVGGYDGRRELDVCEIYVPASDRWEDCAHLLQPRGGLGLAANGGKVYAVGGGWETYLGFSEFYSPGVDQWTVMETPIVGEWRNLGLVAWDTSVYAVGGWDSDDFLNRTYAAEVMPWRVFIPGAFSSP